MIYEQWCKAKLLQEQEILMKIIKWHNMTPKLWIPEFKVTEHDADRTLKRIETTADEDLYIGICKTENNQIIGFVWAFKQEQPKDSVMILSLYVEENYRKQGIAVELKKKLEEWCLKEGVKQIQTTVHYTNKKMISLNERLGYEPGMLYMTKKL